MSALDELKREANRGFATRTWPQWSLNAAKNSETLRGKRVRTLDEFLPEGFSDGPLNIIASGAQQPMNLKYPAILGATAVPTWIYEGHGPISAVTIMDSSRRLHALLWPLREALKRTSLILPVTADPLWLEQPVSSDLVFFLPVFDRSPDEPWTEPANALLRALFPQVRPWLPMAGCVTNQALFIAQHLTNFWPLKEVYVHGYALGCSEGDATRTPRWPGDRGDPAEFPLSPWPGFRTSRVSILYGAETLRHAPSLRFKLCIEGPGLLRPWLDEDGSPKEGAYEAFCKEMEKVLSPDSGLHPSPCAGAHDERVL